MALYHQWSYHDNEKFSVKKSGERVATTNFYPLKATNYNWNTSASAWNIYDTTFYTYSGPNLIATITRKNSSGVFLTRVLTDRKSVV